MKQVELVLRHGRAAARLTGLDEFIDLRGASPLTTIPFFTPRSILRNVIMILAFGRVVS